MGMEIKWLGVSLGWDSCFCGIWSAGDEPGDIGQLSFFLSPAGLGWMH